MAQSNYYNPEPKPFPDSAMRDDWRRYYKSEDKSGAPDNSGRNNKPGASPVGHSAHDTHRPPPEHPLPPKSGLLDSLLGSIKLSGRADGDRILLLGLLLLLSGEDCDRLLLLAILYILI